MQVFMVASFNDLSMIQYNDGIAVSDGCKSMGHSNTVRPFIRLSIPFLLQYSL